MNTKDFTELVYKDVPDVEFLSVDRETCTACGKCVIVCPMFLWKLSDKKAELAEGFEERCLECGACWQVCESGAISFDFPSGGKGIVVKYG